MQLSKRLQALADLAAGTASPGGEGMSLPCIADVGTDHGYLPIYLTKRGSCQKAIALDINKGPLQRAQAHIREHRLGAYIETRLSDGLEALRKDEAQVIVIAGMGGATMRMILEKGAGVIAFDTVLVLQPQSELREFRYYLMTHAFQILAEDMVFEDGKYYPMMRVQKCRKNPAYTESELRYGPLLLAQCHPVLIRYLKWQQEKKQAVLKKLRQTYSVPVSEAHIERRSQKVEQMEEELQRIHQLLQNLERDEGMDHLHLSEGVTSHEMQRTY